MKYKTRETNLNQEYVYTHAINTSLLRLKNVNSYYVGKKIKNGKELDIECLIVGVSKKEPAENLEPKDLIPEFVNGLPTDVIESEIPIADDLSSANFCGADCGSYCKPSSLYPYGCPDQQIAGDGKWYKCIPGGVGIGCFGAGTGTLGFNASTRDGRPIGMTNNHVVGMYFYHPSKAPVIQFNVELVSGEWKFTLLNRGWDIIHSVSHDLRKKWTTRHFDAESDFSLDKKFGQREGNDFTWTSPSFDGVDSPMLEGDRHYQFHNVSENASPGELPDFSFRYDYIDQAGLDLALNNFFTKGTDFPDPIDFKHFVRNLYLYEKKGSSYKRIYDGFGYTHYGQNTRLYPVAYPGETYDIIFDRSNFNHSQAHYYSYQDPSSANFVKILFFGRGCTSGMNTNGTLFRDNEHEQRAVWYPSPWDASNPAGPGDSYPPPTSTLTLAPRNGSKFIGHADIFPMYAESTINAKSWNHGFQPSNVVDVAGVKYEAAVPLPDMVGVPDYNPHFFTNARRGMLLTKSGRTTGLTQSGYVLSTNWTGYISYCGQEGDKVLVTDCIKYETFDGTYFSDSGDSGSAVLSTATKGVIGLNFAGRSGNIPQLGGQFYTGYGCKIENITSLMGIQPINDFLIYKAGDIIDEVGNLKDADEIGHCGIKYVKDDIANLNTIKRRPVVFFNPPATLTPTPTITPTIDSEDDSRAFEGVRTPTVTFTPPTGTPTVTSTPTYYPPTHTHTFTIIDTIH